MTSHLVGDVTIRYADIAPPTPGDPVPVLLLHGFGVDFDINWRDAGWPDALALAGRRVIGPDLRGHGASDKPTDSGLYLPEHFVADILVMLDDLGVESVDVVAYSMGARIAWEFARTAPKRVRRLVLGGFGPHTLDLAGLGAVHPGRDSAFDDMYRTVAAIPGNDPAALVACAQGQASHPFREEPRPEGLPLLVVHGAADHLTEGAAGLAERSGGTHVEIPDLDHVAAVSSTLFIQTWWTSSPLEGVLVENVGTPDANRRGSLSRVGCDPGRGHRARRSRPAVRRRRPSPAPVRSWRTPRYG